MRTSHEDQLESAELAAVLASRILGRSVNARRFLTYVCEKYLEGRAGEITEYRIGVEALGRRADFDPRIDGAVRVEAHRIRRRLEEYYNGEGASHPVHIVIPPGNYTPQFVFPAGNAAASHPGDSPAEQNKTDASELAHPDPFLRQPPRSHRRPWYVLLGSLTFVGLIGVIWLSVHLGFQPGASTPEGTPRAISTGVGASASEQAEIRILAGSGSGKYTDLDGHVWAADRWFTGGRARTVRYHRILRTKDPVIFQTSRESDDFSYHIPLKPGCYELRLFFAESSETPILQKIGEGTRVFRVTANGKPLLPGESGQHPRSFDIVADAGGTDIADVKVFKDISPAADGFLHLRFFASQGWALVNGIEIVAGVKGRMRPLRWVMSQTPYTDSMGQVWAVDRYYQGGRLSVFQTALTGSANPELYHGERFGHFSYCIPVAKGRYSVTLRFAENYYGNWLPSGRVGSRIFDVYTDGVVLLKNFDVFKEAGGGGRAISRTFRGLPSNPQEKLVLSFVPVTDYAIVNAIEVIDEGK